MLSGVAAFPPAAAVIGRLPLFYATASSFGRSRHRQLKATLNINGDDDPLLLQTAIHRAFLRFLETNRQDPLFVDQYAGCFVSGSIEMEMKHHSHHHHCLATKFIDDKLLSTISNMDGPKQVVLFTDGMDTRPYRLSWPPSTIIFDISPERVFRKAAQVLEGVGAKVPRGSLYRHVSWEALELEAALRSKGFNGSRQSLWVLQMNVETWMDKLFLSNGFRVKLINYNEVAENLGKETGTGEFENVLFVAEQLRFSDDQMETWRREFQRIEEEGDEEGFEEL